MTLKSDTVNLIDGEGCDSETPVTCRRSCRPERGPAKPRRRGASASAGNVGVMHFPIFPALSGEQPASFHIGHFLAPWLEARPPDRTYSEENKTHT